MAGSPDLSFDPASMSNAVDAVLNDCLYNIIADTVLKVHREEKQARMQSAAIIVQQTKDLAQGESSPANGDDDGGGTSQPVSTNGARIDEENRIYLRENPLRSTRDVLCPTCRLPRLQYPTTGRGARAPDPGREYCARQPWVYRDGCDIYGKSLVPERPSKKKKVEESKGKGSRSGSDSDTPANGKDEKGSKPAAASIPSGKCPYCPRYMAFTRIAQHMDRCLKAQQRQNATPSGSQAGTGKKDGLTGKLAAAAGDTPRSGSRASTPKPGANRGDADDKGSAIKLKEANGKKRKLDQDDGDDDSVDVTPVKKKKIKKDKEHRVKDSTPALERKDSNADSVTGESKKEKKEKLKAEKKLPGA